MPTPIVIEVGNLRLTAELSDTPTAQAVARLLPIEADFQTWGEEYYFPIPLDVPLDATGTLNVNVGDLGYWPPEKSLAIFCAAMSTRREPICASLPPTLALAL